MDIGVSTACMFGGLHIEDAIREYGRLGIGTTEVFLNTFSEHDPVLLKAAEDCRRQRRKNCVCPRARLGL